MRQNICWLHFLHCCRATELKAPHEFWVSKHLLHTHTLLPTFPAFVSCFLFILAADLFCFQGFSVCGLSTGHLSRWCIITKETDLSIIFFIWRPALPTQPGVKLISDIVTMNCQHGEYLWSLTAFVCCVRCHLPGFVPHTQIFQNYSSRTGPRPSHSPWFQPLCFWWNSSPPRGGWTRNL